MIRPLFGIGIGIAMLACIASPAHAQRSKQAPDKITKSGQPKIVATQPSGSAAKLGVVGYGTDHYVLLDQNLPYTIRFENLATATGPAQEVVVTDVLDGATLDLNTVSLDRITFGSRIVQPSGLDTYSTEVDLRPQQDLLLRIAATLDHATGIMSWSFNSIDPATGQPPTDPQVGFLPPNVTPPEGQGSVLFTVMPRADLTSGTQIRNRATITFDGSAPITTPYWINTIDVSPPQSEVLPLAAQQDSSTFTVRWGGSDAESGLAAFTVFVSEEGGSFLPWRENTTATAGAFTGTSGHSYAFYSVAWDYMGNVEAAPASPDASTRINPLVGVSGGEAFALAFALPAPNPASLLDIGFTLPSDRAATIELLDMAGRRVEKHEVGTFGRGHHSVRFGARHLPSGLYFVRLTQGTSSLQRKVCLIR